MEKNSRNYGWKIVATRKMYEVTGVVNNVSYGSMNLTNPVDIFVRWIARARQQFRRGSIGLARTFPAHRAEI